MSRVVGLPLCNLLEECSRESDEQTIRWRQSSVGTMISLVADANHLARSIVPRVVTVLKSVM